MMIIFALYRDTTVQSLTVQPTVNDGIVTFQDSPLVRAARDGSVLVVDEADKAPTQVTCILKVTCSHFFISVLYNKIHLQYPNSDPNLNQSYNLT